MSMQKAIMFLDPADGVQNPMFRDRSIRNLRGVKMLRSKWATFWPCIVSCFEAPVSHDKPLVRLKRLIGGFGGQVRVLGPTVRRRRSAPWMGFWRKLETQHAILVAQTWHSRLRLV
ncbi:hypothetical protein MCOR07_008963 [Pyricularia oryzae]|nr:hypothetical protein MCOR01_007334 [Pyricularia oryzae]KAI6253516.1 hypothetical protein MCOR19_009927 [Pyricularia oryzae]KAI6268630.1 hypothetical protein MCOR26_009111 [Pyricularia oryzae]KAI6323941.1 hypothetical protein MCOR29_004224 [Pyricularia oryzae]KAI6415660.1 hypothetical protein MCOR20_001481 [Pyricularia oryzae]